MDFSFPRSIRAVVLIFLLCAACSKNDGWAQTSRELHKLAGPSPIDCGYIHLGDDQTVAINCAKSASEEDQPFTIALEPKSTGPQLIEAIAHTSDNRYFLVKYNSNGWDPNALKPGDQLLGKLFVRSCTTPPTVSPGNPLTCK